MLLPSPARWIGNRGEQFLIDTIWITSLRLVDLQVAINEVRCRHRNRAADARPITMIDDENLTRRKSLLPIICSFQSPECINVSIIFAVVVNFCESETDEFIPP